MCHNPTHYMTKKIVRTYVDESLRREFARQFPGTGSISWLLETAMREVLEQTKGQPSLKEVLQVGIRAAVLRERISNRAAKNARAKRTDHPVSVETIVEPSNVLDADRESNR